MRRFDPNHAQIELKPAVVNVKQLAILGSCLWLIGLIVMGVRLLMDLPVDTTHIWIGVSGLVLGLLGFGWAHRNHMIDDEGIAALPETIDIPSGESK